VGGCAGHPFRGAELCHRRWGPAQAHAHGVNKRATWAVLTAALLIVWSVAVALVVLAFTDRSADTKVLVAAAIAGPGAAVLLWLRMKQLP
jgi:heme/copper-type cytochrome/quinol oxidase subunit 2